ncbi:MAG: hypothetical protein Q8P21_01440 [bacterium]|nr:hypothetical protein [bacterium]
MKKYFFTFICLGLTMMPFLPLVSAEEAVKEKINARVLPTVWFSSLEVIEGDKVKVYAGIQNNSGIDFSGLVIFYADDTEIGRTSFDSRSDSLIEVSVGWTAKEGRFSFQAKVETTLPGEKALLSYESEKAVLLVSRTLTLAEVKEDTKNILSAVAEKVDEAAVSFAQKLESFKKPNLPETETKSVELGTSSTGAEPEADSNDESLAGKPGNSFYGLFNDGGSSLLASAYNAGLDLTGFMALKWKWTLVVLAILIIIISFR